MTDEGPITIASAVVVPGDPPERNTKRRTSSSTIDGSKRPRLNGTPMDGANRTRDGDEGDNEDRPSVTRKRKSLGGEEVKAEERKRGQRLFGALLGTIGKFQQDSQSARARAGANRRKKVEEKLQQKLRQQNEELDEKKRRESTVLQEKIQHEQQMFEERWLELKHANLRARANYLCTKAKPPLYYLPWKLIIEEEACIREQIEDAEATIKRERADFERRRAHAEGNEKRQSDFIQDEHTDADPPHSSRSSPDVQRPRGDDDLDTVMVDDDIAKGDQNLVNPSNGKHVNTNVSASGNDEERRRRSDTTAQDVGDVVIEEAGEDTVIY